jgi:hypothetical protein
MQIDPTECPHGLFWEDDCQQCEAIDFHDSAVNFAKQQGFAGIELSYYPGNTTVVCYRTGTPLQGYAYKAFGEGWLRHPDSDRELTGLQAQTVLERMIWV